MKIGLSYKGKKQTPVPNCQKCGFTFFFDCFLDTMASLPSERSFLAGEAERETPPQPARLMVHVLEKHL
jgi:hypothetical protein